MSKKYDTLVYIGRFQPLHNAHIETIRRATQLSRQVVIIVGSAHKPRTYKNPFTSHERELMLLEAINRLGDPTCSIRIEHNIDTIYNDQAWAGRVQALVSKHTIGLTKIGIIGHDKDESTFYFKMFPQWQREHMPLIEPLNATDVRELYFKNDVNFNFIRGVVPDATLKFLHNFSNTPEFQQIIREREFIANYKKQFEGLKYPPVFVTGDAVVIQSGHILMIERKSEPGRGLWALPGGFLKTETDRSVQDTAIRELREETKLKVPAPVLIGNIKAEKRFDAIDRSERGRTITTAFKIVLPDGDLPQVKASDDAKQAVWMQISDIKSDVCFEDHYEIIQWAIGG